MTFVRFGLIVTGRGERRFLKQFFRAIMAGAHCTFEVIRKSEQLNPISSKRRQLKMVGSGQIIPTIDEEQFGLPARLYLQTHVDSFVIVIDDLEGVRRGQVDAVFARYRNSLDRLLAPLALSHRASVHFLVNMLEAYYFAHAQAVNNAANTTVLEQDHSDDVENIDHPKGRLKQLWEGFDEVSHGEVVISELDLGHVLSNPEHCCWLRSLFGWCVDHLPPSSIWDDQLHQRFHLAEGCRVPLTTNQAVGGT